MNYPAGSVVKATVTFINPSTNAPVDPDAVCARVLHPDGQVDVFTYPSAALTKTGTGEYALAISVPSNEAGSWTYRFEGTGANAAATPDRSFSATPSRFYP